MSRCGGNTAQLGPGTRASSGSWHRQHHHHEGSLARCTARIFAAFLLVASVAHAEAMSVQTVANGIVGRDQGREVPRSQSSSIERGRNLICSDKNAAINSSSSSRSSTRLVLAQAFGCAAVAPRRTLGLRRRCRCASGMWRGHSVCSVATRNGEGAVVGGTRDF